MELIVRSNGTVRCVYNEALDLHALGQPQISRASKVEPTPDGRWTADLAPVGGPVLGPFITRSVALAAEQEWLGRHWLCVNRSARAELIEGGHT